MNTKEKNAMIYHSAYQYLIEILPCSLSENDLEKYFWGDKKDFSSLKDVFEQMIHSAQNYQRMPNVIKFQERREKIKNILFDFDVKKIVETYEIEELYKIFRKEFNITSADNKFNSWHKWSKSIIDSAKFLSEFKNVDDFKGFVGQFDYNVHTRMALPLLISEKISGMGFALACDFLKELGYINYPKPDVHLIDVLHDVGLSEKDPLSVFEAIVKMSEYCKEFFKNENITPYQIDKIIWLICSGKFYYEKISVGQHKKELIQLLQENIKNIKIIPRPTLGTWLGI